MALDTHPLYYFLVEIIEKFLTCIALSFDNFGLQLPLELVELELNLLWCAALLVNSGDAFFKIDSRLYCPQHLIAGAKYTAEETKLLSQQFVHPLVGGVVFVEEVHHHYVELLPIAMTAADTLLDTLGVPGRS